MYRLKLFGGVSVEGPEGPLRGRIVQRRQLALLALLAATRVDPMSRDKLVGILWPEIAPDRSRQRLSDTLHVLRKTLGDAAVLTPGEDLALNDEVVRCDVRDFRRAMAAGAWERALELYAGPLLDGFHVDGPAELERWVDRERRRARRDARRAAGELATAAEAEGAPREAARWARRALAIEPYDEVAARELIRLLALGGDRAAAVEAYESFAERYRTDLEMEPSAETEALLREIRHGNGLDSDTDPDLPGERTAGRVGSLTVLPLEDLSSDPDEAYFAAGMHDALIGELAGIEGLRVISRTSAACYEDSRKPVPEIARELDVDAVLEGSVLRADDRVRIKLQLLEARPEERHLWARTYDREIRDVLALHTEVARAVAREIGPRLSPRIEQRLDRARRVKPAMYEAYLRGRFHINRFTPEGFRRGLACLERAVEEDPADPLPHAALALAFSQYAHESGNPSELFPRAQISARRALELDDTLAEAHEAIAETKLYWEWDWLGAERAFDRALEINPNLALAHAHRSWYLALRRREEEGAAEMRRAAELDPLVPLFPAWQGWQLVYMERLDEATDRARSSLELQKDFPIGLYVLGEVHAARGEYEEAIERHARAAEVSPAWAWGLGHSFARAGRREEAREVVDRMKTDPTPMTPFGLAVIHAALGEADEAFRWLNDAFETRFSWIPWIDVYPMLDDLREDPRFRELVRRLELPA